MGSESKSHFSLKKKLKSTFTIIGCFGKTKHHHNTPDRPLSPKTPIQKSTHDHQSPRLSRTLSKSQDVCRNLMHRIGEGVTGHGKHIRRHTADFHYDPSSYALNFDKGDEDDNVNRFPVRNFSSRLPHSPPFSMDAAESSLMIHNLSR